MTRFDVLRLNLPPAEERAALAALYRRQWAATARFPIFLYPA